jgi:uncharacterized protein (TIGR04255 family)
MAQTTGRRRYRNPPIEEALVEFQFAPGQDWDLTIPGKLHEKVKATYPGKPRQQRLLQASLRAEIGQPPGMSVEEGIGRVQLVDADGRRLLSLGPDVLSVNVLRPYDGWEVFKPHIDTALRAYAEVSGVEKISRIGVRYINKVVVPEPNADLSKYFLCAPPVPAGLPSRVASFLYRTEHVFDDDVRLGPHLCDHRRRTRLVIVPARSRYHLGERQRHRHGLGAGESGRSPPARGRCLRGGDHRAHAGGVRCSMKQRATGTFTCWDPLQAPMCLQCTTSPPLALTLVSRCWSPGLRVLVRRRSRLNERREPLGWWLPWQQHGCSRATWR